MAQECADLYQGAAPSILAATDQLESVTVCWLDGAEPKRLTLTRQMSEEMMDSLAGLLVEPSSARPTDLVCTAEIRTYPDFVVETATGASLAPVIPTDECGKPSQAVVDLLYQITGL